MLPFFRFGLCCLLVVFCLPAMGQAPEEGGKKDFRYWLGKPPIETITAVGKRVIESTPFQYHLTLEKQSPEFDFIKVVDFERSLGRPAYGIAYARTEILASADTQVVLEISHNDGARIWVNGKEVYTYSGDRAFSCQTRERDIQLMSAFSVSLKKGRNPLVIKSECQNKRWLVYLQPKNATIEFSVVRGLSLGLKSIPEVDPAVSNLSQWLLLGPLGSGPGDMNRNLGPEENLIPGKTYSNREGKPLTWTIPKTEIFTQVLNPHPLWGTLYNYNYHTAGLAWAMGALGKKTNNPDFLNFTTRYCDFMLDSRPMVEYQYNDLHGFRSVQHHMVNTPLLDFTAAPTLPYVWMLGLGQALPQQERYRARVTEIQNYLKKDQVRLPDGTFTRETPEKFTTWVDDMFMGIPFLVHSALAAKDPAERTQYLDEAARQVLGFNKQVWNPKDHLYHHARYSNREARIPYWSRANGWGIFATTLVLQHLPERHPARAEILATYRRHAERLTRLQDPQSGFWHQVLDDKTSYLETSGTAIFTMALARGLNQGWIKGDAYHNAARKGWDAISTQISPEGDVFNICIGTMSSEDPGYYKTRPLVKSDSHGLIGVFWAAMEMQDLAGKGPKK